MGRRSFGCIGVAAGRSAPAVPPSANALRPPGDLELANSLVSSLAQPLLGLPLALFQQGHTLREHLRLVAEPRDRKREMQQEDEDEAEGDEEESVRGIRDPDRARELLEEALPYRQPEQHESAEQPQQRVALEEGLAPHEFEHDQQQETAGRDGEQLNPEFHQMPCEAATGASPPGSGTGRARASPMNTASSTLIM